DESAASYPRPSDADFEVTPDVTSARLDWLTATVGWFKPVRLTLGKLSYDVTRVRRRLGPATGAAPRIGSSTIDVDLADGRFRLSRRPIWQGRKVRWATFLLRVRERD